MRVIKNAANNDPAATLDSHLDCRALLIQIVALQTVINLAPEFLAHGDFRKLFISDKYGGHLSPDGNHLVAGVLAERLAVELTSEIDCVIS